MEQIDILLATYNGEKYLKEQIDSILSQTYSNFRLIISDDCSNDRTREILKEYEEKDNRIKVYYQEKNLGYVKNFEFLLTKVENEIYALSDQDDVWLPEKIEKSYNKMKESGADLIFTDLEVVNENLETICPSYNDHMRLTRKIEKYKKDYRMQYMYNCITGCTLISKREFLKEILPMPINSKYLIHDSWIGLVISLCGKIEYLDEKTIRYRQHGNNQVGIGKISHQFRKLEDVRNLFIDVKIKIFTTYVNNEKIFPENLKKQNREALKYFKMLQNKKHINFKGWRIFHKLYKTETFSYYIQNFMIINIPVVTKIPFTIRQFILKLQGKR